MKKLLLALSTLPMFAAPPTVTGCTVSGTFETGTQIYCNVSVTGQHSYIEWGTSSGVYPNRTKSVLNQNPSGTNVLYLRLSLGGLTPGTTYFARASARPNSGDITDIGYSSEISFTTTAAVTPNPPFPTLPTEYIPIEIDTASYYVVLMKRCSSGYPCADGAVAPLGITNEAGLQAVINAATYGTAIRFPRSLDANIEHNIGDGNAGYELTAKAVQSGKSGINDLTHDWIVFEGEGCSDSSYFPPFGSRIDPTYQGILPVLRSTMQQNVNRGSHFNAQGISAHHYAWRCLELATPAGEATNIVNPAAYRQTILLSQDFSLTSNFCCFLIDRVLALGLGGTKRQAFGWLVGAANSAVIGSHLETGIWRPFVRPSTSPSVGGTGTRTLTIPAGTTFKTNSANLLGGNAASASAVVTSAGVAGRFVYTLTAGGSGNFYYDTRSLSSVACSNCTAIGAAADPTVTTYPLEYVFITGSSSSAGALSLDYVSNGKEGNSPICSTIGSSCEMAYGIELGYRNPGPVTIKNNYVSTTGLAIFIDSGYEGTVADAADVVIKQNWVNIPRSRHYNDALSDGYRYSNRQLVELKRGARWLIQGNLLTGSFAYQNISPAVFISGRGTWTSDTGNGIKDITVRSNEVAYGSAGFECSGNIYASSDALPPRRILFENNFIRGINRYLFDNEGPGALNNSVISLFPACQQIRFRNNTSAPIRGQAPFLIYTGGDSYSGAALEFKDNLVYYGQGDSGCSRYGMYIENTPGNATYPRLPAFTGTTVTTMLASTFNAYSVTNNLLIGGKCYPDSLTQTDLSSADVTARSGEFPGGQIWPSGATMAEREIAAGISPTTFALNSTSPYRRSASDLFSQIGADLNVMQSEQGVVSNISISTGYSSVTARYLAPDTRACTLDVSSNSGATWTRATDTGGNPNRTLSVSGLSPATNYSWRLLCYFAQTNDGRQWDDWPASKITSGTVTTASSSSMVLSISYGLNVTGATKARITVYKADGTTTQTTCTASPCSVDITTDGVDIAIAKLSVSDVVLATGGKQRVIVQ